MGMEKGNDTKCLDIVINTHPFTVTLCKQHQDVYRIFASLLVCRWLQQAFRWFHEKLVFVRFRLCQAHTHNAPVANAIRPIDRINMEITKIKWTFYVWSRENETWMCNTQAARSSQRHRPMNWIVDRTSSAMHVRNFYYRCIITAFLFVYIFQFVRPNEKQLAHFAHLEHVRGLPLATIAMPKSHY